MEKILIIDDDALVLKTLKNLFERKKYTVQMAKSGQEALQKLENEGFDLILCDIRMAELNGIETIRKLREKFQLNQTRPVIFMTGYASEEVPIEAIKLGAKDYILKPFDLDELLASVQKNLGESQRA
ncbi:MAG: response regulator [Candidatus Omnitrophica bacterium]|nr:response regulator [Candidatus Omnitrophota bacterium]MDD5671256.1 response regulator [Candidatus Omnitrophota bacterium]